MKVACFIQRTLLAIEIVPQKLLILDLDETLIHATKEVKEFPHDFVYHQYYVYKRPYLDDFLADISAYYQLAVWSSADDQYVNDIIAQIKPSTINFEFIWGRTRCTYRRDIDLDQFNWEKRLKKIKKFGYRLESTLIVDDTQEKCKDNYGNAIYINEFNGDPHDAELKKLKEYLVKLSDVENVRTVEKRYWNK